MRAALLLSPLVLACLPNPQSVKERRDDFPRDALRGEQLLDAPPPGMKPVGAVFGDRITLMGYETIPEAPKRGDNVDVRLYWSVSKPVTEDYMIFVHGDAIGGNARRIHGDHWPAEGKYPTDVWREGEVVVDRFKVRIDDDYGAPRLGIFVGLYKENYRVPMTSKGSGEGDNENRIRPIEIVF